MTLKKSCSELNSDQLGKLAVMLLNCQSYTEGRMLYECNEKMTLKDCTTKMDGEAWNTYHLMTNRARAVCAIIRQEQFRGLTEMTVNKLMNTAHDQIDIMKSLAQDQEKMKDYATTALNDLSGKNEEILSQQSEMIKMTDAHRLKVESNLLALVKEKSLIKAGQIEVAELISILKSKIG